MACLLCVLVLAVVDLFVGVPDLVPPVEPVVPAVVPAELPVPSTELLLAMPGEFCTCEMALALACVGPCELERAVVRRVWPLLLPVESLDVPPLARPGVVLVVVPVIPPVLVPVELPLPSTELLFAAPGEFCT